jgi:hypothetical protein
MADGDVHATMIIPDEVLPPAEHSQQDDREGAVPAQTAGGPAAAKTGKVVR